jgi:hypothetical protein
MTAQHQTLTVKNTDGSIIVPVQYKVEEMLYLASRNVRTEWHDYCLNAAISWASR